MPEDNVRLSELRDTLKIHGIETILLANAAKHPQFHVVTQQINFDGLQVFTPAELLEKFYQGIY
ncbi:MAG: hypothetical protein ACHQ1D_09415 [Nitrososphaerales archaeon]